MKYDVATPAAYQLMHDGALALSRVEQNGIRLDVAYCKRQQRKLTRRIEHQIESLEGTELYGKWKQMYKAKTNVLSGHQLGKVLYEGLGITPQKLTKKAGTGASDEEALRQLNRPELDTILMIRRLTKIRDTYLEGFLREQHDGWIHPFFNLHTVRTYRSSSDRPNFQNIPKRDKESLRICRKAFYPREGHMLVEMDLSAIEVMISCCYHKDPTMLTYVRDKSTDMHLDMAKQIFKLPEMTKDHATYNLLRQAAKNGFVFPQFYGDYYGNNAKSLCDWAALPQSGRWKAGQGIILPNDESISDHLIDEGITSFARFTDHMKQVEDDFWNVRFEKYGAWRRRWVAKYEKRAYLTMLTGFVCSGMMSRNEIINYPIQGTAFHCLLLTLIKLDSFLQCHKMRSRIIGQVHDSIVLDAHPDELVQVREEAKRIVQKELPETWDWLIVPLEIDSDEYDIDGPWIKE